MAFNGQFLFKFGNYAIPLEYIQFDSYSTKPNQRQDMDSYTDADGVTQRNALAHTKTDIQFTVRKLYEADKDTLMSNITNNYINAKERDAMCTYYDTENGSYKTGHFYLDPSLQIDIQDITDKGLRFKPISFHFVEY